MRARVWFVVVQAPALDACTTGRVPMQLSVELRRQTNAGGRSARLVWTLAGWSMDDKLIQAAHSFTISSCDDDSRRYSTIKLLFAAWHPAGHTLDRSDALCGLVPQQYSPCRSESIRLCANAADPFTKHFWKFSRMMGAGEQHHVQDTCFSRICSALRMRHSTTAWHTHHDGL